MSKKEYCPTSQRSKRGLRSPSLSRAFLAEDGINLLIDLSPSPIIFLLQIAVLDFVTSTSWKTIFVFLIYPLNLIFLNCTCNSLHSFLRIWQDWTVESFYLHYMYLSPYVLLKPACNLGRTTTCHLPWVQEAFFFIICIPSLSPFYPQSAKYQWYFCELALWLPPLHFQTLIHLFYDWHHPDTSRFHPVISNFILS